MNKATGILGKPEVTKKKKRKKRKRQKERKCKGNRQTKLTCQPLGQRRLCTLERQ